MSAEATIIQEKVFAMATWLILHEVIKGMLCLANYD